MKTLEGRLKKLKKDSARERYVNSLLEQIPKAGTPLSAGAALDDMLRKLAVGRLERHVVVLESRYKMASRPYASKNFNGKKISKYQVNLCRTHLLANMPSETKMPLEVEVNINKCTITFTYTLNGKPMTKTYHHSDFLYFNHLTKDKFHSSKGIIIKRTRKKGIIALGGSKWNFGHQNNDLYAVVLFDNGKIYPFDLEGKALTSALSSEEAVERLRLLKAHSIRKDTIHFDAKTYLDELISRTRNEWARYPGRFAGIGRSYIIEGELQRETNHRGNVDMILHYRNQSTLGVNVGVQYPYEKVMLKFYGKNVLVHDIDGELLNARKFKSPIKYTTLSGDVTGMKTLSFKTVSTIGGLRTTAGPFNYCLSKKPVLKKYGSFDNFRHVGIMAYIDPSDMNNSVFELLLIRRDGYFISDKTIATSARIFRKPNRSSEITSSA